MKRTVFLSLLLVSSLLSNADDWSNLGNKGKGTKTTITGNGSGTESFSFDALGNLIGITTNRYDFSFSSEALTHTSTGFSGSCNIKEENGKISITKGRNGITKILIKHDTGSLTISNSYDSNGILTKSVYDEIWYTEEEPTIYSNIGSELDRYSKNQNSTLNRYGNRQQANLDKLQKKMDAAMSRGDMVAYQKAYDDYMRASSDNYDDYMNESGRNVDSYMSNARAGVKMKRVKHTKRVIYNFSDYAFDEFGNWISRMVSSEDGKFKEQQIIDYDSEFWSKYYWEKLKSEGDLRKIEAFVFNKNCHKTYQDSAKMYWNERILAEVERVDKNNRDSLCHVAKSRIISETNKEKALNLVREDLYANVVMPIRDYARVDGMKNMSYNDFSIFDNIYKKKIEQLSQQLRQDSITFLSGKAKKEFEGRDYVSAEKTCKGLLIIEPANSLAKEISQEANYQIVLAKEANNSVNENDYTNFIEQYSYSSHKNELLDKRALYASSLFNRQTSGEELERVHNLQTVDQKATKTVNKRYRKWMFKKNRGRFFRIGFGGEYGIGGANTIASGELGVRLGYTANLINGTIGIKYNYLTRTSSSFKKPKEAGNAFFERQYLSVPLMLRFNLKHGYHGSTYVGLGAELNVANLKTLLRDVNEDIKEKEFAKKDMSLSPRIAFGGYLVGIEVELFATYDNENHFNKEFIETYKLNGQPVKSVCNDKTYQKQVEAKDFFDKIHGGLALRLWF